VANQVAFTSAAAVAGGAQIAGNTLASSGKYVALVTYDLGKGGTRVLINEAQSGVVLGYNALTALPAQTLLAIPNAAVFLAYEGPKLVIVKATGALKPAPKQDGAPPTTADLPVGTVVDLKALQQQPGVQVETVTDDPEVTHAVVERMKDDLNTP
jgi:hypothetical protein